MLWHEYHVCEHMYSDVHIAANPGDQQLVKHYSALQMYQRQSVNMRLLVCNDWQAPSKQLAANLEKESTVLCKHARYSHFAAPTQVSQSHAHQL